MNKKHLYNLSVSVIGAFLITSAFLFSPPQLQSLDNALRDIFFQIRGEVPTSGDVVIIDIDEKSLAELGQWPWERDVISKLLQQLTDDGAGMIGLDIVFAEQDKTSPAYLNNKHQLNLENPLDYDHLLGETVANTPTILGYVFLLNQETPNIPPPSIPAIVIEKNPSGQNYLLQSQGVLPNIPAIQNQAYSSGFFNNIPDQSGMVRSVPLVMKYQGVTYPSLALEMIRVATQSPIITVHSSDTGVDNIQIGDITIPTDRYGKLFVNYRGPGHTFPYISALDVINGDYNASQIAGKWLLIGTSAAGLLDLRSMPFDSAYPGVEAHANVIDNILVGDTLAKPAWIDAADLFLVLLVFLFSYISFNYLSALWLSVAAISGFIGLYFLIDYMLFTEGLILNIFLPFSVLLFTLILSTLSNYFFETRQKNLVKSKLASKVSPSVMGEILKNETQEIMQGQTREITVFFSDLRDFTRLSESMPNPQTLIDFLNEYTTVMSDIIVQQQGTIDKFIGDAIMAYWNAPVDVHNHADLAVTASLQQLQSLEQLNQKILTNPKFSAVAKLCQKASIQPIQIGIGLNTGEAVVGEMGSAGRSDYTIIGDTVNLGARLESLCKFYGSTLNISEYTKNQLQNDYVFQFLDRVKVKGKSRPVDIWQVHDFGTANPDLKSYLERYHQAIDLYQKADFKQALLIFKELDAVPQKPNQKINGIYIDRCLHYIEENPTKFDAVYEHTTK